MMRDGQYHMQMECQVTRVKPTEDGYEIFASTQWPTETQFSVAQVLGIPISS